MIRSRLSKWFGRHDVHRIAAENLSHHIMTGGRRETLYLAGLAEDTFEGRFGMVTLHAGLVMRRLKNFSTEDLVISERLGEILFDRFDYAYRETGVSDATIARKVRKLGEHFYGLVRAIDAALADPDDLATVTKTLTRNGLGGTDPARLAGHLVEIDRILAATEAEEIRKCDFAWPPLRATQS